VSWPDGKWLHTSYSGGTVDIPPGAYIVTAGGKQRNVMVRANRVTPVRFDP
jgi:hypothetical protein